ncbi:hypothetical protein [Bacillus sp. 1P06AnD]|uniref:hypothetical protein n=1 Tax=Bacillus sp. 1P06AnD TaxID=3132208 RepID=UPI0039A1A78F
MNTYIIFSNEQLGNKTETIRETERKSANTPLGIDLMEGMADGDQVVIYCPGSELVAIGFADGISRKRYNSWEQCEEQYMHLKDVKIIPLRHCSLSLFHKIKKMEVFYSDCSPLQLA